MDDGKEDEIPSGEKFGFGILGERYLSMLHWGLNRYRLSSIKEVNLMNAFSRYLKLFLYLFVVMVSFTVTLNYAQATKKKQ
jgi:hypothetical protein